MLEPPNLDPTAVRRQFSQRAGSAARADFLLAEVESRLLERLDPVRIEPATVLDVGCGAGRSLVALARRFPSASLLGVDASAGMASAARAALAPPPRGWLARLLDGPPAALAQVAIADAAALPLADATIDLLWSSMALHWFDAPAQALAEWHRVLKPGGVLAVSFLGVDTLAELRALGAGVMSFHDLHDVGDLLLSTGFADPVMDSERLTLSWSTPQSMLADLRALGGNALRGRRPGLCGRGAHAGWLHALEALRRPDGRLHASVELVFGHAWCPQRKRRADGLATVEFLPRRRGGAEGAR